MLPYLGQIHVDCVHEYILHSVFYHEKNHFSRLSLTITSFYKYFDILLFRQIFI